MATIRDYGGTTDPLGSPALGGPGGWCEAVADKFDEVGADGWVTAARLAADSVTAAKIAADAVGASELADGAVDAAALADGSVTPAKLSRPIGNLLTENQASPTTVGAYSGVAACTETTPGAYTAAGGSPLAVYEGMPGQPWETYTLYSYLAVTGSKSMLAGIAFLDSSFATLTSYNGPVVTPGNAWASQVTAVAPSGTAWVQFTMAITDGGANASPGDSVTVGRGGLWKGAGGLWQPPGVPIPNLGLRDWLGNMQAWNSNTSTWVTI